MILHADSKLRVVVLDGENTRVYTNPPNLEEIKNCGKTVLINPLFSEVAGVPPHLWVFRGGKLTHDEPVVKKEAVVVPIPPVEKEIVVITQINKWVTLAGVLLGAAIGYICGIN